MRFLYAKFRGLEVYADRGAPKGGPLMQLSRDRDGLEVIVGPVYICISKVQYVSDNNSDSHSFGSKDDVHPQPERRPPPCFGDGGAS
jgi:hypothetical protein